MAAIAMTGQEPTMSSDISRHDEAPSIQSPWKRQARQLGLFIAGAGCFAASIAVSRRAVIRRQFNARPPFYMSNRTIAKFDSADRSLLAAHALGLATLNVMGFAVMLLGGISWGFDLNSAAELRERTRASTRRPLKNATPEEEKAMVDLMDNFMGKLGMSLPTEAPKDEAPKNEDQ